MAAATASPRGDGAVRGFANRGGAETRFLAVATPGIFGRASFLDLGRVLAAAAGGPPDVAAILEVMRRTASPPRVPATEPGGRRRGW